MSVVRLAREMCKGDDKPCLCDSWVFWGNREACGSRFGECWLKKQKDILDPDQRDSGGKVIWTSGLIFGKWEGIVKLKTEHGIVHVKLLPDCAPHSVAYILELLALHHCAGCQFYRAESRGDSWDPQGNHIEYVRLSSKFLPSSIRPPICTNLRNTRSPWDYIQGHSNRGLPHCKKRTIAWIGSGPEFFISLANHNEWRKAYTVFGYVLLEDMEIVEKIAQLPTIPEVWSNVKVCLGKTCSFTVLKNEEKSLRSDAEHVHRIKVQQTLVQGYFLSHTFSF
ncbi:hypothetical protein CRYUN_Cryun20dG0009100 [Craigia yunnanensis]